MNFREKLLKQRNSLTKTELARLSEAVVARFIQTETQITKTLGRPWKDLRVALYQSLPTELDLRSLAVWLISQGSLLHYPRVEQREKKLMEMVQSSPDHALAWQKGPYGIEEPHPELKAANPTSLDLIIMPGVGFSPEGARIGMGAGYYDRYLPRAPQALRVALALDFQVLPSLPQNPWDQPVHWIITENREIRTPQIQQWLAARTGFKK